MAWNIRYGIFASSFTKRLGGNLIKISQKIVPPTRPTATGSKQGIIFSHDSLDEVLHCHNSMIVANLRFFFPVVANFYKMTLVVYKMTLRNLTIILC